MVYVENISKYRVYLYEDSTTFNGVNCVRYAEIVGYDDSDKGVFMLTFVDVPSGKKIDNYVNTTNHFRIFVSSVKYPWFLDLLRNEYPLEFRIDESNLASWKIRTQREEVGTWDLD